MNGFQLSMLDVCLEATAFGKLTEWEEEFIESLSDRSEDYELSDKQNAVLTRIKSKLEFP